MTRTLRRQAAEVAFDLGEMAETGGSNLSVPVRGPGENVGTGFPADEAIELAKTRLEFLVARVDRDELACAGTVGLFGRLAKATTATIRRTIVNIPARLARSARRITIRFPEAWPWQEAFDRLFTATHAPPPAATA